MFLLPATLRRKAILKMDSNTAPFRDIEREFRLWRKCRYHKIQDRDFIQITFQVGKQYWIARTQFEDTEFTITEFSRNEDVVVKDEKKLKGKRITSYETVSDFQTEIFKSLRVREPMPKKKKKATIVGV